MNFWMYFWTVVLVAAAGGFALLAIVVTIGGAGDIRELFDTLREEHERVAKDPKKKTGATKDVGR